MSVVGIDFGNSTCFIAVARQGGIETIDNEYSARMTPSFVSLGTNNRAMGVSAKNQLVTNMKNTVWGFKKFLGRKFKDPIVTRERNQLPYQVIEAPGGEIGIQVQYLGESQVFSPQQITAMLFTKLKEIAEAALRTKVVDVVISIPNYCTDTERRAFCDAAQMAGLNVLRLMNDTTAVALAYGIYKQDLPVPEEKPRNVVFVDVGHTDLQLCAAAFNKGKLKVLATAYDPCLGGRDFDHLLAEHFAVEFKKKYKVDAKTRPKAYVRLLTECEKLKKLMSANTQEIPINIECFMDDKDVSGRMGRKDFEELAAPVFGRMEAQMKAILDNANLKLADVYSVEVIGGSSRVPAVKALVTNVFGKEPSTTLNSDEAVARGCALQCAILSPTFRVRDFAISDCQPYSVTLNYQASLEEDSKLEVFNRFHSVPFSKMLTFYRKEPFSLHASYSNPRDIPYPETHIGTFTIDKVTPQANGESSKVKVKVRINIHGVFTVCAASLLEKVEAADEPEPEKKEKDSKNKDEPMETDAANNTEADAAKQNGPVDSQKADADVDQSQNDSPMADQENEEKKDVKEGEKKEEEKKKKRKIKTVDLPIFPSVPQLTRDQINVYMENELKMVAQDKLEKERADAKNAVEEYVYDMRDKLSGPYEKFIKEADREKFSQQLTETEDWLYEDGEDEKKQVYIDKINQLKKVGQPVADRYRESLERPQAFNELGYALQQVRKALDLYSKQDEKYAHLEAEDMKKVEKCMTEKAEWFEKQSNAQQATPIHEKPAVLATQIRSQRESLISTCNPILNKPKPKPKEEPPKDDGKQEKKETNEGQGDNNQGQSAPEGQKQEQSQEGENKPQMDVD